MQRAAGDHSLDQQRGRDGTQELRDPIAGRVQEADLAGAERAQGHGRVEVSAGDGHGGAGHHGDGQTVGQSDGDQPRLVLTEAGAGDGADADEDECEGPDEFGRIRSEIHDRDDS